MLGSGITNRWNAVRKVLAERPNKTPEQIMRYNRATKTYDLHNKVKGIITNHAPIEYRGIELTDQYSKNLLLIIQILTNYMDSDIQQQFHDDVEFLEK